MTKVKQPKFVVVGRVNEGKSSVVASLAERQDIEINMDPGTTHVATPYEIKAEGRVLFTVVDTPGFEEPEAILRWLQKKEVQSADRPARIKEFLQEYNGTSEFEPERELLTAITEGAILIYVVSGSHPYRQNFESEMEILRWTGAPRIALINKNEGTDYSDEWRKSLTQFFNVVSAYNSHKSRFQDRLKLLDAIAVIEERLGEEVKSAKATLLRVHERRLEESARLVTEMMIDMINYKVVLPNDVSRQPDQNKMMDMFYEGLGKLENQCRLGVERVFGFAGGVQKESDISHGPNSHLYSQDLQLSETYRVLGLSKLQLIAVGALAGGGVGAAIDVKTLGATGFLATPIGAALGGLAVAGATVGSPEKRVGTVKISGTTLEVGPHKDPNFPWVILDRALLHFQDLVMRTHATQQPQVLKGKKGLVSTMADDRRRALQKGLARGGRPEILREQLQKTLEELVNG